MVIGMELIRTEFDSLDELSDDLIDYTASPGCTFFAMLST